MKSDTISIGRGLCIILMVMAHAGSPMWVTRFVYMFHMPFFFIISGYCLNESYFSQTKLFLEKRVKGLYIPYIKWSLLFLLLHNVFFHFHFYDTEYGYAALSDYSQTPQKLYEVKDFISHGMSVLTQMEGHEQLLGGYWFLKELFLGSIIGFLICKHSLLLGGGKKYLLNSLIAFLLFLSVKGLHIQIPYLNLNWITFLSTFYYCVGYDLKRFGFSVRSNSVILLMALVVAAVSLMLPEFEMGKQGSWYMFLYIGTSVLGFFFVMNVAATISRTAVRIKSFLIACGNHTLSILTWHFISFKLVSLFIVLLNYEPLNRIAEFPQIRSYSQEGWWIAYTAVGVIIPLIISHYYTNAKNINYKSTRI